MKTLTPIKAIRAKCLDCCCGSAKAVKFCTCDGKRSTACPLWPYRLGMRPATAARKAKKEVNNPPSNVALEDCR